MEIDGHVVPRPLFRDFGTKRDVLDRYVAGASPWLSPLGLAGLKCRMLQDSCTGPFSDYELRRRERTAVALGFTSVGAGRSQGVGRLLVVRGPDYRRGNGSTRSFSPESDERDQPQVDTLRTGTSGEILGWTGRPPQWCTRGHGIVMSRDGKRRVDY
jgi:hypothetical protein